MRKFDRPLRRISFALCPPRTRSQYGTTAGLLTEREINVFGDEILARERDALRRRRHGGMVAAKTIIGFAREHLRKDVGERWSRIRRELRSSKGVEFREVRSPIRIIRLAHRRCRF